MYFFAQILGHALERSFILVEQVLNYPAMFLSCLVGKSGNCFLRDGFESKLLRMVYD